jgi:nucleotide-binding universal stress UspA family protein
MVLCGWIGGTRGLSTLAGSCRRAQGEDVEGAETMKIMVPLDTSELSASALPLAERLASALGAELLVVTVADADLLGSLAEFAEVEGARPLEIVESYLKRMSDLPTVPIQVEMLATNDPATGLVERAGRGDVEMIVMASHGRSAIQRWMMGSVSERVVRGATVPVTVVPAPWRVTAVVHRTEAATAQT